MRKARRTYAWPTKERIHLQARVIRDGDHLGGRRDSTRFDQRVILEGGAVFHRRRKRREDLPDGDHLNADTTKQRAELRNLAEVVTGEHDGHERW